VSRFTLASDGRATTFAETMIEMHRSLAKALLAVSFPLRLTAHLTDPAARGGREHRRLRDDD
jgi:hypothetical protein